VLDLPDLQLQGALLARLILIFDVLYPSTPAVQNAILPLLLLHRGGVPVHINNCSSSYSLLHVEYSRDSIRCKGVEPYSRNADCSYPRVSKTQGTFKYVALKKLELNSIHQLSI
jgi:hypothetical protein